jgi:hypothetical protein
MELQNNDGGWDSPLDDGNPSSGSDPQMFGFAALGLAKAYQQTGDPCMVAALQKAGTYLLSKVHTFWTVDGTLAVVLDELFGGNTYTNHVKTNFYGPLASGSYADAITGVVDCDTAEYIQAVRNNRTGPSANLAAWDLGLALYSAHVVGVDTTEWLAGLKEEIDELDGLYPFDVLGLAGAVFGLAGAGEDYDPQAGQHAAASSLADLAVILSGYQLATGGFTYYSQYLEEGQDNETIQETVYGLMALNEFDRRSYSDAVSNATAYLESAQLGTGGWENYAGSGEENATTGESLRGVAAGLSFLGDFDDNGEISFGDFAIFAAAWHSGIGDPAWNPDCDVAAPPDDFVNGADLAVFVDSWLANVK